MDDRPARNLELRWGHPVVDTLCSPRLFCLPMDRRSFLQGTATTAAALAIPQMTRAAEENDLEPIYAQVTKQHDENV
jgi:TAT (twin-arginine translocation) pathway signal sequence